MMSKVIPLIALLQVDWTINAPLIFTMVVTIGAVIWNRATDVKLLTLKFTNLETVLSSVQDEIKILNKTTTNQAIFEVRLAQVEQRQIEYQSGRENWRTDTSARLADIGQALANVYKEQGELKAKLAEEAAKHH